ncbi:BON domain-containing protein [Glaciecola siphonariae]|uniref:BON domain-containing protein n=1 Tax=Glaciecola siphonariae TaxID=521012 RepID=A0ABV9LWC4_9ALTE
MKRNKLTALITSTLVAASISTSAMAMDNKNTWKDDAMDAWIDGKAEATLLFNGNLDSFDINTDVNNSTVTLTGKVETSIDKELAEELVLGIDGVESVDNRLTVMNDNSSDDMSVTSAFTDAKISSVVKSRLLFDSEVSGTAINVDVDNQVVTLKGKVQSEAAKQLAVTIAQNTNDVKSVNDDLMVESESE